MKLDSLLILHIVLLFIGALFISFIISLIIFYVPKSIKKLIRKYRGIDKC